MYARAPRNPVNLVGSTPIHIGPGTYDSIDLDIGKKQSLDSYAPFLSLSLRDDIFKNITETPGPGEYNLRSAAKLAKGGSSLANRAKRFSEKVEEIPGPGSYQIENKENKPIVQEIKISKHRIKLNRKKNPPSIQDPKLAYGFEEAPNGDLIPQAPPERDPSLGPAYYNSLISKNDSPYKGIHFGKYSSKRSDFVGKTGPGPGDYDTIEPVHVDVEHYHMKNFTNKKPELNIPRYPDVLVKTIEKESIPGPGKYEQKRLFEDSSLKQPDTTGFEIERPPFGTQAKRFYDNKTAAPGPGAYSDQRTALTSLSKTHSLKKTPFLQSSIRFDSNSFQTRSAPGPGQYRINGFAEDNLRKAILDSRRKPAFGQSAPRKFDLSKKEEVPGPAQYQIKEKAFKPKKENYSANFASNVKQRELVYEDTPGPTAYDVPKAFDHLIHYRREAPRNKKAMKRQESFNVVSKREFDLAGPKATEIPGPGTYDYESNQSKSVTHFAKLNEKRWKERKEKFPGPADYDLSPLYKDTVLKGTFNATLNNPLIFRRQKANSDSELSMNNNNKFGLANLDKIPEALQVS